MGVSRGAHRRICQSSRKELPSVMPAPPWFHVVLCRPEIPNNTGNIGRTCIATGCALHLVRPLGFDTSEKALRRAGLDYWPRLGVIEHSDWGAYVSTSGASGMVRRWYFTTRARRTLWDAPFRAGDHLVFGSETVGLPEATVRDAGEFALSLPMAPGERSLNLATAVCAAVYEGLRQLRERRELRLDRDGRLPATVHTSDS